MPHVKFELAILILVYQVFVSLAKLPVFPECGQNNDADRIIGGEDAALGSYTWLALIAYEREGGAVVENATPNFLCGGSLITSRYVLTAAHCKQRSKAISVRLGEHKISTKDDCDKIEDDEICAEPVQDIPIESFIVHENYVQNVKRKDHRGGQNDIALIKLEKEADITDYSTLICLPTTANNGMIKIGAKENPILVMGWGVTGTGDSSDVKQYLTVPLVDRAKCDEEFQTRIISESQLCAGGQKGQDACSGDSGGSLAKLQFSKVNPFWMLLGVVSYGPKCSKEKSRPSVYVNVAKYVDWIESKIE